MGYERNDGRYGGDRDRYRGSGHRDDHRMSDHDRARRGGGYRSDGGYGGGGYGSRGDQGRPPQGYDHDDRGFFDRAGDEVRSWFGDEEAERRRRMDERYAEQEYQRERYGSGRGDGPRDENYAERARRGGAVTGGGFGRPGRGEGYGYNPSGDYGAGRGAGATSDFGLGAGRNRDEWGHDPNYRSWRDRQMAELDRDYDEYRRENQSKFESDFGSWRSTRTTQRQSMSQVREHQEVVGSDGKHVGTVDKVRGDRIILTKTDKDAGGHHHSIPCSWLQSVADKVTISKTADEAQRLWRDEQNNSAFGYGDRNRDGDEDRGATNLNRSFSGTY